MVASEATPFAQTGGLADVLGALPPALVRGGDEVAVVLPRYGGIALDAASRVYDDLAIHLGRATYHASLYEVREAGVAYYFVDIPELYDRPGLYGTPEADFPDNHMRFAALSLAALGIARYIFRPRIFHLHDWQAGLLPAYLRHAFAGDPTFMGMKSLFTIHNLGYQGIFAPSALGDVGLDATVYTPAALEFYKDISFLKSGIVFSEAINTVSPTYAREIQTPAYGCRMDGLLRSRAAVLSGILNGVDYTQWDPATDPHIAAAYTADDLSGKRACKRDLLREVGWGKDALERPLIGIVSRFAEQKGFDLIEDAAEQLAAEELSMVALGSGEARYETMFQTLASAYPDKIAVRVGWNEALSHKIEAGADMFLMPSRYEPCGLNQIYSLRYGTVPIVRATGGLDDTIDTGTGFKFKEYAAGAMLEAVRQALGAFRNRESWCETMRRGMRKDFSWTASATEYSRLYRSLLGR